MRNRQKQRCLMTYRFVCRSTSARIATVALVIGAMLAGPAVGQGQAGQAAKAPAGATAAVPTVPQPAEAGLWVDDTGEGAIEISPCGKKLCGRIVWLQEPLDKNGKPQIDDLNPTAGQRGKPVCGLQVVGGLEQQSDGTWDNGWVYDPKVGESFDLAIALRNPGQLVVTGYKGLKLFSKKFIWTRAAVALPPCTGRA